MSYFLEDKFKSWLGKDLERGDGTYDDESCTLTEWYNGVHWNTRIRVKGGGSQVTDDVLAEGTHEDRSTARAEAENLIRTKLTVLFENAGILGIFGARPGGTIC